MSRIGRHPVAIPAGVTVEIAEKNVVTVKGPKGTLVRELPVEMEIKKEGEEVIVTRPNDLKKMKSLHGLTRTLINNMVIGVTEGYEKVLEVNGVGYRASKSGNKLTLNLGYSHPVEMEDPEGIETVLDGQNKIISLICDTIWCRDKINNENGTTYQDAYNFNEDGTYEHIIITTDSEGTEHINKTTRQWSFYDPAFNTIYFGNKHYWDIDRLNKEQFSFYDRSGEFGEIGMSREYVTLKPYAK